MAHNATAVEHEAVDAWITTKIRAGLFTEQGLAGREINVETQLGAVSLPVKLPSPKPKRKKLSKLPKRPTESNLSLLMG